MARAKDYCSIVVDFMASVGGTLGQVSMRLCHNLVHRVSFASHTTHCKRTHEREDCAAAHCSHAHCI